MPTPISPYERWTKVGGVLGIGEIALRMSLPMPRTHHNPTVETTSPAALKRGKKGLVPKEHNYRIIFNGYDYC